MSCKAATSLPLLWGLKYFSPIFQYLKHIKKFPESWTFDIKNRCVYVQAKGGVVVVFLLTACQSGIVLRRMHLLQVTAPVPLRRKWYCSV